MRAARCALCAQTRRPLCETTQTQVDERETAVEQIDQMVAMLTGNNMIARAILAVLAIAVVALISHLIVKWLRHLMRRDDVAIPQSSIVINIARGVIWGLGVCFVLDACFEVNMSAIIAALGVGGIAISLGFQDTLANLIGGTQISFMRIVEPGDNIEVGGDRGVVQDITWRQTTIKARTGEIIIIPNSVISKTAVIKLPPPERVLVPFAVTVSRNLDEIEEELLKLGRQAAEEVCPLTADPDVLFSEVTEYCIRGRIGFNIEDPSKQLAVASAVTVAITPLVRE